MNTPICDFARDYCESGSLRTHMPGHKGLGPLGFEALDLTEFDGADDLYHPGGIIRESERNASGLFGCETLYSTEGSSQCIRAMLYLAAMHAREQGRRPIIAAGRNAHKTFLSGCALLDLEVQWLYPEKQENYLSCRLTGAELDAALSAMEEKPAAVYLTSPDYLGHVGDIAAAAEAAHRHGCLLLVDNAHGAYLRFLPRSRHPMDLGADLCCDSAHKTLPVLTGGAYLHISDRAPGLLSRLAKDALAMFGSTSPSYLILQSLDAANRYLAEGYREKLAAFVQKVETLREKLTAHGYALRGEEPTKLTFDCKAFGYDGVEFAEILRENSVFTEFYDPDHLVMMLTPETGEAGLARLEQVLLAIPKREAVPASPPGFCLPQRAMSIREAAFSPNEEVEVGRSLGRVLASASVGCPPAVPILVCGEVIDEAAIESFQYYGIDRLTVVK